MYPVDASVIHVVDDDDAVRDSLAMLLESHGLTVRQYNSAEAFLDGHHLEQPGCIVLDLHLPVVSGIDLIGIMRDRRIELPVVLVTGRRDEATRARALKAGVIAFLEKPVSEDLLLAAIWHACASCEPNRLTAPANVSAPPGAPVPVPS